MVWLLGGPGGSAKQVGGPMEPLRRWSLFVTLSTGALVGAVCGVACELACATVKATSSLLFRALPFRVGHSPPHYDQQLAEEMHAVLEVALSCPEALLEGRNAAMLRRVLRNAHRLQSRPHELPWQLVLIHQRLELLIDHMPYEDLYSLFGGNAPPRPTPEAVIKSLKRCKPSACLLKHGLGSGADSSCPICLQPFSTRHHFTLLPGCRHAFHPACVSRWLRLRGDCPVCRQVVEEKEEERDEGEGGVDVAEAAAADGGGADGGHKD